MELVTPGLGLIFWTSLTFFFLMIILKKFAWKPILTAVKTREDNIEKALSSAKEAEEKMQQLTSQNEQILREAREERDIILKEARAAKDSIVGEAKNTAKNEAAKIMEDAKKSIENEKLKAITELKNQVAALSIEISEKILGSELSDKNKQQALMNTLVEDVTLN
ncbi:MAG: F0F1 ATP synthase subunit B [Bacteroidetes bacterium]|nr:F0F1 ATP synthase subunit B [Bacteroidota bacterium]